MRSKSDAINIIKNDWGSYFDILPKIKKMTEFKRDLH